MTCRMTNHCNLYTLSGIILGISAYLFNLVLALLGWRPSTYLGNFRTYVTYYVLRSWMISPRFGEAEITKKELNRDF